MPARVCLVNDEAVVEVVAILLLNHMQLFEPQVHVEDGLNTFCDLIEIQVKGVARNNLS